VKPNPPQFEQKSRQPGEESPTALLRKRLSDFGLTLHGTRLETLVKRLYDELDRGGVKFKPAVYLSDEWGCPDGVPIIGVPFYLANEQLTRLEDEMMEGVEAETDEEIMRYLRHEAGHALNYAYLLHERGDWTAVFGPFSRPYVEDYTPDPFSVAYVRHLPGWYAQKHPDEDFAETFAVWLAPDSNWREAYANWECLTKLEYVDGLMREIGPRDPVVRAADYDTAEQWLSCSLEEHYRRMRSRAVEIPPYLDGALRDLFPASRATPAEGGGAAAFVRAHRRKLMGALLYWTGLNDAAVRGLVNHVEQRCAALKLAAPVDDASATIELAVLLATLCMNKLHKGDFVSRGRPAAKDH
jgi:hypothetical protein